MIQNIGRQASACPGWPWCKRPCLAMRRRCTSLPYARAGLSQEHLWRRPLPGLHHRRGEAALRAGPDDRDPGHRASPRAKGRGRPAGPARRCSCAPPHMKTAKSRPPWLRRQAHLGSISTNGHRTHGRSLSRSLQPVARARLQRAGRRGSGRPLPSRGLDRAGRRCPWRHHGRARRRRDPGDHGRLYRSAAAHGCRHPPRHRRRRFRDDALAVADHRPGPGRPAGRGPPSRHGGPPQGRGRQLVFFIDHPFGADAAWAVDRPPRTD